VWRIIGSASRPDRRDAEAGGDSARDRAPVLAGAAELRGDELRALVDPVQVGLPGEADAAFIPTG
jgi:hypothetical protein